MIHQLINLNLKDLYKRIYLIQNNIRKVGIKNIKGKDKNTFSIIEKKLFKNMNP